MVDRNKRTICILGGGLSGLSAAYHLKKGYTLFEKEKDVGGLTRSCKNNGYVFDYSGHLLHFRTRAALALIRRLSDVALATHNRNSWIFSNGVYTKYPFQANTYGLPTNIVKECILKQFDAGKSLPKSYKNLNFEDWIYKVFGEGIGKHFMIPYNKKFWTLPLKELTCEWIDGFIPLPSIKDVLIGAVSTDTKPLGYNRKFWYPVRGGIETVVSSLYKRLKNIYTSKEVVEIDITTRKLSFKDGCEFYFDRLISTIPLPELGRLIKKCPSKIKMAFSKLCCTSIFTLNLGVNISRITDKHWIYFPESKYVFFRVGFPMNFSPNMVPRHKSSIYAEVSYSKYKPIRNKTALIKRIISDLIRVRMLNKIQDIDVKDVIDIKYGYPVYNRNYSNAKKEIFIFLKRYGIITAGRFGSWRYMTMEDSLLDGRRAAGTIKNHKFQIPNSKQIRNE